MDAVVEKRKAEGVVDSAGYAAERAPLIVRRLRAAYPDARVELDHDGPFQLLMATILSAQCTDVRVNQVTPQLFRAYPTPEALAAADPEALQALISPTGFYHRKAEYLQQSSRMIVAEYGGQVPADMDRLLRLPGVSRKTANVVLGAFGIAQGIVVDTHVKRLAGRLGLSAESSPDKIERDLMALWPAEALIAVGHLIILHGRRVCFARRPDCEGCVLNTLCPSARMDSISPGVAARWQSSAATLSDSDSES